MTRVLIGVGSAVGLALCAAVVFLAVTDFSRYRTNLEAAVSEATGRDLRIAGNFQPEVFPLSFVAEDVTDVLALLGLSAKITGPTKVAAKRSC